MGNLAVPRGFLATKKTRVPLIAALSVLSVALVSCSGDGNTSDEGPGSNELISQLPPADNPVDLVKWNLTAGEPTTLDPRNSVTLSAGNVVSNLCENLLQMDAEFNARPQLAEVDQVSPTEVRIDVRDDATFWDGSPVTAEDVAFSLERSADPENSVVAIAFDQVNDISVEDDHTVKVTFDEPNASFLTSMSTIAGAVIKKDWAETAEDAVGTSEGGLMCSGPYKLEKWKNGSKLTITANEDYWKADAVPKAKQVDFTFITDTTAVTQALDSGEIDGSYELPPSVIPSLSDSANGKLLYGPSTQTFGLSIATPEGQLADQNLREALQKAIDRDALATAVFEGAAEPTYTMLSTTTWPNASADVYEKAYPTWEKRRAFDVEAAKKLVEQSDYDGTPIVLGTTAGNEVETRVSQLVQQQAQEIGIKVKIEQLQPLVASQAAYDETARKGLDLLIGSSFNTSQNPLEPVTLTVLPGQPYNTAGFDNDEATELILKARSEFNPDKQAELLVQAQEIYEDANITIPLVETRTTTFLNNRLTGAITSFAYWSMPQMMYVGSAE